MLVKLANLENQERKENSEQVDYLASPEPQDHEVNEDLQEPLE
jgi:hypothetical protein